MDVELGLAPVQVNDIFLAVIGQPSFSETDIIERGRKLYRTPDSEKYITDLLNKNSCFRREVERWPQGEAVLRRYPGVIETWKAGNLLIDENWMNLVGHQLGVGLVTMALATLYHLPPVELDEVVFYGLAHDWDKRLEKEKTVNGQVSINGKLLYLEPDAVKYAAEEGHKVGLLAATGDNALGFENWGPKHWMLRVADCLVGPVGESKIDDIVPFQMRLNELYGRYNPEKHKQLFQWFKELEERVYPECERNLFNKINNPINDQWIHGFYNQHDLVHIVRKFIGLPPLK